MASSRSLTGVWRDLKWGFSQAFWFTVLFGGITVLLRLLIGPDYVPGVTLSELILTYVVLGLAAGTLIGVFRPLTRGWWDRRSLVDSGD